MRDFDGGLVGLRCFRDLVACRRQLVPLSAAVGARFGFGNLGISHGGIYRAGSGHSVGVAGIPLSVIVCLL